MDAGATTSDLCNNIHIHNYSFVAVESFISEVKKYPIIYNGNTRIPFARGLIDFAWARIVAALLDTTVHFDFTQKAYWDRSFRELWKWMRTVLKKDMIARRSKPIHICGAEHSWLIHLKFLERFIQLGENTSDKNDIDSQLDPDIRIQVHSSETVVDLVGNNHTVIWLRDSSEPANSENTHISICFRTNADIDFNKRSFGLGVLTDNSANSIPSSSTGGLHIGASCFQTRRNADQDAVLPLPGHSIPTIIDEDYQYVMSLLPKLKQLDPRKNAEVKVLMIQALHEVL